MMIARFSPHTRTRRRIVQAEIVSPFRLLAITTGAILLAEAMIMSVLHFRSPLSWPANALIDTALLTLVVFPLLYLFLFRPLLANIAERRQAEEALRTLEKLTAAGEMAAMLAHEFRNSLTSIRMILELQRESRNLDPSERKSLDVALSSIGDMENLVAQLLNFSRPAPMAFRPENLNGIIEESLDIVNMQINKAQIRLKKVLDPALPLLALDAQPLKEALINVILNAIQAIASKGLAGGAGRIAVATKRHTLPKTLYDFALTSINGRGKYEPARQSEIELVLPQGTACALIKISDNGRGIDPDHFSRIFDPFFTTKSVGTGLGLSVVKRTVNALGGIVTVKSKLGKGASFHIYLPLPNSV